MDDEFDSVAAARAACSHALDWLAGRVPAPRPVAATLPDRTFTMTVTGHQPADAFVVREVFEPAFEVLQRWTQGRVQVRAVLEEKAHPSKEGFAAVADGRSDFGPCYTSWEATRHPMSQLLALPRLFPSSAIATAVSEQLYPHYLREEFERPGVVMGRLKATGPYHLFSKVEIARLRDLEGLRVATTAGIDREVAEALGATTVVLRSEQLLPAFESGAVDAVSLADGSADVFGIGVRALCRVDIGASRMNLEYGLATRFVDALPESLRTVLNDWLRAQAQAETQVFYGLGGAMARERFVAAGCRFVAFDARDRAELEARMDALTDRKAAQLDAQGLPGRAFVDDARAAVARLRGFTANELMAAALRTPVDLLPRSGLR